MAGSHAELTSLLRGEVDDEFEILSDIAAFTSINGIGSESTDLVIRALEKISRTGPEGEILRSLAMMHGLYPYAVQGADHDSLRDAVIMEMNRPNPASETVFHRIQSQVFHRLVEGENVILSAPTSFGKSVVIDALVQTGRYKNLVLVVPTIALLDETRRRLSQFREYKIVTHPNQELSERNILVMTQERLLAVPQLPAVDLFFIDEFYKLAEESEGTLEQRASMLNQAFLRLAKTGAQFYFAGPVVEGLASVLPSNLRASFIRTDFSTVAADTRKIKASNDEERLAIVAELIGSSCDPTLVYCQSPAKTRKVLEALIEQRSSGATVSRGLPEVAEWIEENYHPDWIVSRALRRGVGVHHGRLPRWLAQKMVQGFEDGDLDTLVCTNSLIEGVNTRAKRIIILDRKVANRAYNYFTFANIRGRVGRMFKHFVGEIVLFHDAPTREFPEIDIPGVSQSDIAPSSLLVQIDEGDWSDETRERVSPVLEESGLSLKVLRSIKGVEPEAATELAKHIRTLPTSRLQPLQWSTSYPKWAELRAVCELIWNYIPPSYHRGHGAYSAQQLAYQVNQASLVEGRMKDIIAGFVENEHDQSSSVDEKIEAAFDFVRYWLDHNFPTALRALDVVVSEILEERGLESGSFDGFAARVESMFSAPHLTTLEEYGLPLEISRQLVRGLGNFRSLDEMLEAIQVLRGTERIPLTSFERSLLGEVVATI